MGRMNVLSFFILVYFLHLKVQKKICISRKTGIPLEVLDGINGHGTKLTARALLRHNTEDNRNHCNDDGTESMVSALSVLSVRPKDETPEERSERKRALRQYRRVCDMTLYFNIHIY
jgi:protein LTV1